ncbi:uncharacterized protein LOC115742897 [Rhodamnia argentea]|uniref:Uncharacterized protein LOC115742897 n=1 Tax=Rhodamnia argentea TaxID=178133 RepID=A0A8B8PEP6_9MYRT|nr:uncharacterized protein LOC115742897 [Rhodamnia argentea]
MLRESIQTQEPNSYRQPNHTSTLVFKRKKMGIGESNNPITFRSSSIALLQERFRQLQKVKEMREERQLLRSLTEPNNKVFSPTASPPPSSHCEPLGFLFHDPEVMVNNVYPTCSSPPWLSLSLWPSPRSNYSRLQGVEAPALVASLWPVENASLRVSSTKCRDYDHFDDVDTSLHL